MRSLLAFLFLATQCFAQLAITHVSVIPMTENTVLKNQTVVIEGDKIKALGPAGKVKPPKGAQIIDGSEKFLIPGLVDAHVHLLSPDEFPLYLHNGVTTVFNLDGRPQHLAWRKQIAEGKLQGPTIFTSGPIFFGSRTPEGGVKAVDQQADAGYDALKVFNQVSPQVYAAVTAAAKKRNLLLIGHIPRAVGAEAALEAGQSVAHADEFLYTYFNPKRAEDVETDNVEHIVTDELKLKTLAEKVRLANVAVEPTLITFHDGIQEAYNLDEYLKKPEIQYLAPWVRETISPTNNRFKRQFPTKDAALVRDLYTFQQKMVRAFHDMGVPLLAGTDATDSGPVAGFGLHDELEELNKCGLSEYETLKTATINPTTYFRKAGEFGTIAVGKRADLVLLTANPLQKIGNTRKIAAVILRGKVLDRPSAADLLARQQAHYKQEADDFTHDLDHDPKKAAAFAAEHDPFRGFQTYMFVKLIADRPRDGYHALIDYIRTEDPDSPFASEAGINRLGYDLMQTGHLKEAIVAFEVNTIQYPDSANTFDSLAEAQFKSGNVLGAVISYRHALQADPKYPNADFATKFIAEHSQ